VIGNGFLPDRLPALPAGLSARPLNADDADGIHPDTPFGWLNGASLQQGLRLQTARNARIAGTVHVLFCNRADAPCHAGCRLQLDLAEGSALTLVEHYLGDGPVLANALTRIRAGANSRLTHYRLQSE